MRTAGILAALLFAGTAEAQTNGEPVESSLVEPEAPPGSPPSIRPGTISRISAGESALLQTAILGGSEVEIGVRGMGPVGAVLYDPEGNRLSSQDSSNVIRFKVVAPRDGIYYLAPLGNAGTILEVSLAIVPPPGPEDAAWKVGVTDLPVQKTIYGGAFVLPANGIVSGNFAQAASTPFDPDRPAILYRFEGRLAQRVKVAVQSPEAHSLIKIVRFPDDPKPLRSTDSQYPGDVSFDSVLDRYLPADGTYYIVLQAYARGSKGERDPTQPAPDHGKFTIQINLT